ncbi:MULTISPECIES: serine/threonine protein kinase [Bacillus cereus group]|uniref:serine/threonine protein kinase n=1 Tax=Bacillus cereus group TaxID=86661 RepID=UPI001F5772AE|nr:MULTISPECIES: serine/threonine protein kinase [Bacillus cereus group]MDA2311572.1 serine/threonine protein kinase [Bacillus cereus]MDA2315940.1 serine/threonine protein kinase [Bacillus cereus]MDA2500479.1 serine/threonine protein kinase [Bacillus cereus]MDA2732060.1 serine/threonine protein kinase [Bacillus cereus]MDF9611361.1 serine/threonine protein kinase [Bacillus cereus]
MKYIPVEIQLNQVIFQLKEHHNFDWLLKLGNVFAVFDQQDSGNLSFGVERDGHKKFIKYAGARTIAYEGTMKDAIERLKSSVSLYEELMHDSLIKLIDHFPVQSGYVLIFDWFDGECLHSHWSFPPPDKYKNPNSPFYKFKHLPVIKRIQSLNSIFSFHTYVEKKNYVAIDFYDGSILYDFHTNETKICDIDLYSKKPFVNKMGRLWGSSRFMSPEEFELNAIIDSRTNVFNMGAMAFAILGGGKERSFTEWEASRNLYEIAYRAVNENRTERYASVKEFYEEWVSVSNTKKI